MFFSKSVSSRSLFILTLAGATAACGQTGLEGAVSLTAGGTNAPLQTANASIVPQDPAPGVTYLDTDPWAIEFYSAEKNETTTVSASDLAGKPKISWTDPTTFTMTWKLTKKKNVEGVVKVRSKVTEKGVRSSIKTNIKTEKKVISAVVFPIIGVSERVFKEDDVLVYPRGNGWLVPNPIESEATGWISQNPGTHPGSISMQWTALYNKSGATPMLYLATEDQTGHHKAFRWQADKADGTLAFSIAHAVENPGKVTRFELPYDVVVEHLEGDWYDAAQRYRSWALQQEWVDQGPLLANPNTPPALTETTVFSVVGGEHEGWTSLPEEVEQQLAHLNTGRTLLHTVGWHNNAFDEEWGEWFPLDDAYKEAAKNMADNVEHVPYVLVNNYMTEVPSFADSYVDGHEDVSSHVARKMDGTTYDGTSPGGAPFVGLCDESGFLSDYVSYLAARLHDEVGANGMYLDILTAGYPALCYDENHDHALGGGDHHFQARLVWLEKVLSEMRNRDPNALLYSEAPNEMYIGKIDVVYDHYSTGTNGSQLAVAPIYDTVYHEFQVTAKHAGIHYPAFQNQPLAISTHARMLLGAHLFSGRPPWAGGEITEQLFEEYYANEIAVQTVTDMTANIVSLLESKDVREFVYYGQRLRDPISDSETITLPEQDLSMVPYGPVQPTVYSSLWKHPTSGDVGVLVVNWTHPEDALGSATGGDQVVTLHVDPESVGSDWVAVSEVTAAGETESGIIDVNALGGTFDVPAMSARFFRLTPVVSQDL